MLLRLSTNVISPKSVGVECKIGAEVEAKCGVESELNCKLGVKKEHRYVCGDVCDIYETGCKNLTGCEVEAKSESRTEMELILESDRALDVAVKEKREMEMVANEHYIWDSQVDFPTVEVVKVVDSKVDNESDKQWHCSAYFVKYFKAYETYVNPAGKVFDKWKGLTENVARDKEIVWPQMVIIMNTQLDKDDNGKWLVMKNAEHIEYFQSYEAVSYIEMEWLSKQFEGEGKYAKYFTGKEIKKATLPGFASRGLSIEEAELLLERSVKPAVDARNNFWKVVKNTTNHGYNQALVAASIGSYGTYLADGSEYSGNYGHDVNLGKLKDFHRRRLQVLVNAGPDILALETIPNKLEAQACVELLEEENVNIPSWICFSSADGVNGPSGESFQQQQRNSNFSNKWGRVPVRSGGLVRKKTDNICNFWIQGFCKFGDRCKYINLASEVGCMLSEGPWVFVGLQNGVKAWNVQTATELSVDAPGGQVYAFVVGNDFLFDGTQVGTILAWQYNVPTNSFEHAALLNGHTLAVITLVVGANKIYSGSMDNLIRMYVLIFVGTNGKTYFNTAALVSCVQNFPKSHGPVVCILKGIAGLSGAILSQIYILINSPDSASLTFMVAVGPAMVVIPLMFIVCPVGGHRQVRSSDGASSSFIYCVCLILAAYLMGVMLVEDLIDLNHIVIIIFTVVLFIILLVPIVIPLWLIFTQEPEDQAREALLTEPRREEPVITGHDVNEIIFSEVEDEKPRGVDLLPATERHKRIAQLQAKLAQAAAEGAVRVKSRRGGPRRGEDFTLMQALIKADFWLIFFSLLLGSGSGLTVIDNLGQMSQSLGYDNTHIFVSLISIWNFLGRVGGGYFSEIIVKDYAYPRHLAMAIAQFIMAFGHLFMAMGWPGAMYVGTLVIGLGYGAHWAIVPAAASELFGLKKFGALYNFLTLANPAGTLIFSSLLASSLYDSEAAKQAQGLPITLDEPPQCYGVVCFSLTLFIMSGFCILAVILSMTLVYRTKVVYANLYGKPRT